MVLIPDFEPVSKLIFCFLIKIITNHTFPLAGGTTSWMKSVERRRMLKPRPGWGLKFHPHLSPPPSRGRKFDVDIASR
jgi:hypothetical protein